jgi:ABC-2 type transport system ATP-binding protein
MIQVDGLTKYYGQFKAIDNLSFSADTGEILGFLGPNGAGKTTTMRILTGYMPASEGTAIVAGYDIFDQSVEARQRIGYLPETVPLYNEMTVWQYVNFMAELHHYPRDKREERVEAVLDMVDMLDREDSLISSLSKGMRQRIGLAQALVHEPEVLILDEPTIGLDPRQVREVRELIRSLGQNRTVLLSTHILSEVSQLCNRILIINRGRIVAEDSPETLAARLQGAARYMVRVGKGDSDQVKKVLGQISDVSSVIVTDEGFELTTSAGANPRPAIAAAIVNQGWDLLELRPVDLSLEDIFLQLTQDE